MCFEINFHNHSKYNKLLKIMLKKKLNAKNIMCHPYDNFGIMQC
jgi:hypothetical protein